MAAKKGFTVVFTPQGKLAYAFMARPDDRAPEGASFKPDGKYKGTVVIDGDVDVAAFEAAIRRAAREEFGSKYPGDEDLVMPIKPGKEGTEFDGKMMLQAKTAKQPECVDAKGKPLKPGVFPKSGDTVRFKIALVPYEKAEKVREGKKMIDVVIFGVSARMYGVQLISRGAGGGGGWDEVEGDYDADQDEARGAANKPATGGNANATPDADDDLPF